MLLPHEQFIYKDLMIPTQEPNLASDEHHSLQGFASNSTPLNCNTKNLVARDGYIATILKNRSDTLL
jgi:hypothetical protein